MQKGYSTDKVQKQYFEPLSYVDSNREVDALTARQEHHGSSLFNFLTLFIKEQNHEAH